MLRLHKYVLRSLQIFLLLIHPFHSMLYFTESRSLYATILVSCPSNPSQPAFVISFLVALTSFKHLQCLEPPVCVHFNAVSLKSSEMNSTTCSGVAKYGRSAHGLRVPGECLVKSLAKDIYENETPSLSLNRR